MPDAKEEAFERWWNGPHLQGERPDWMDNYGAARAAYRKGREDEAAALASAPAVTGDDEIRSALHAEMMNLECDLAKAAAAQNHSGPVAYRMGHRDARHAVAERLISHPLVMQLEADLRRARER